VRPSLFCAIFAAMTTGAEFYRLFSNSIDMPYSGYLSEIPATRLAKDALFRILELKYEGLKTQKQYDELTSLIALDEQRTVRSNRVYTSPIPISNFTLAGVITTSQVHQLQVGDTITLSDVSGFSASVNGSYVVITVPSTTSFTITMPAVTGLWTAGTGSVTTAFMYADMMHPFTMKTTVLDGPVYQVANAAGGSAPYIAFSRPNPIRENSLVRITSTTGLSGLDGDFYLRTRGLNSYYLYTDADFTSVPVVTGAYAGGSLARLIVSEYAEKLDSDRRIADSYTPTVWRPKYGVDTAGLNLYPQDRTFSTVVCDYMKKPAVFIDCENTTVDLELHYPFRILSRIKDEMVKMYYSRMRELQSMQAAAADEQANP
jgi:hypothetical protein